MSIGAGIANEVDAALLEAAAATGDVQYAAVIADHATLPDKPWGAGAETFTAFQANVIGTSRRRVDETGALIMEETNEYLVSAISGTPKKGGRFMIGDIGSVDISQAGSWPRIMTVDVLSPGGVDFLYRIEVEK